MLGSLRSKLPSAISTRLERGLDRFKAPQKRDPALRMEREFALLAADRRLLAAAVPTCEYRAMLKHISSKRELWGDDYDSDDEYGGGEGEGEGGDWVGEYLAEAAASRNWRRRNLKDRWSRRCALCLLLVSCEDARAGV